MSPGVRDSWGGWLASLILEDEVRPDLDIPSNYRSYWTRGSLDRALPHGALRFYLQRRRIRPFDCALTTDSLTGLRSRIDTHYQGLTICLIS